jgi:hypothetical protein
MSSTVTSMANTFVDNRDAWMRMSEIDYLGQFVKSWLAFNAWYRSAYTETQDRKIVNEMKWQSNPVLSKLRPMLEAQSDDAEQFRAEIGLLHQRLQAYELHVGKGIEKKRISFSEVYLKDQPPRLNSKAYYRYDFEVELLANRHVRVSVVRQGGTTVVLQHQGPYDLLGIEGLPEFQNNLTDTQRIVLRDLYKAAAPRWIEDITTYVDQDPNNRNIRCGAYNFMCGRDVLFAASVEIVYQMRCTLFHGELVPTKDSVLCYEPAYRLVRRFLECVS